MTRLLDEIETALDRDSNSNDALTPDQAKIYLVKMEAVMKGEISDRESRLREALKVKAKL
jgi:hypothetical protein